MSGPRLIFDGLWRCLCPSVSKTAATRLLNASSPLSPALRISRQDHNLRLASQRCRIQRRRYGTEAIASSPQSGAGVPDAQLIPHEIAVDTLLKARISDLDRSLPNAPLPAIYDALRQMRNREDQFLKVGAIITHLIQDRGEELSSTHYEYLVHCMIHVDGSAELLARLMAELKDLKIKPTSTFCHSALAALAIHPNYLLRHEILTSMRQSWTEVDLLGNCNVALGLLRDKQYELAFAKLEYLIDRGMDVYPWVYDIFIFTFAHQGFVDEAIRLAQKKAHKTETDTSLALWYTLLDICSRAFQYEGTRFIWGRLLEPDRKQLSDGILLNILNTAARHHDPELATSTTQLLVERGRRLQAHHFEALIESYTGSGDIENALRILCIMAKAAASPTQRSTRPMYQCLVQQPSLLEPALEHLATLKADYAVPVEAVNVLIEAGAETKGVDFALAIYKNMQTLTSHAANHITYRHLVRHCKDPKIIQSLVADSPELVLKANRQEFKHAIFEEAATGELDRAFRYVNMLSEPSDPAADDEGDGDWLDAKTLLILARRCLDVEDSRVMWLVDEAERRNVDIQSSLARLVANYSKKTSKDQLPGIVDDLVTDEERGNRRTVVQGDPRIEI